MEKLFFSFFFFFPEQTLFMWDSLSDEMVTQSDRTHRWSCFRVTSQVRSRDTAAPIGAFMWPLHWSMWVGIFVTLHLTALFLTLYEWNSPFGMTPHGRNRLRVFSYSSALNLCYAILFGRTVATKVQPTTTATSSTGATRLRD